MDTPKLMSSSNFDAVVTAMCCSLEGGQRAQVSLREVAVEFEVSKAEASQLLHRAADSMQRRCTVDVVVARNDAQRGVRQFHLRAEEEQKAGEDHLEVFQIRRSSLNIQDAATLQWGAELESCWEEYQRRLPEELPVPPQRTQVVDLSDEDCCVLD
eukprot:s143_g18.t1